MNFGGMDSCSGLCGKGMYRDPVYGYGSPHFGRQELVVTDRVAAGVGAGTHRTLDALHDHGIDPISLNVMSGSYCRQHVPSYTHRPVMNDVRGFGCGSGHVGVCQPSVLASGMNGFGHGSIPGASHNLNSACGYPCHGNHAIMGQYAPWDNTRRKESDSI
eukprot:1109057-Amphidinium_carterae.1